jgi:hypothetical protein
VPNETVIEAMIKGLRLGPTQYFARKPPQTLDKLLQKMDEYIRVDNDFCQRRDFIPGMSDQFTTPILMMNGSAMFSIATTVLSLQACNKLLSDHRLRGAEEEEVSVEEGLATNRESCIVFFVARTRATQQEHARLQFRCIRKLPKLRRDRVSRSKSSTLLRVIPHTSQDT